MGTNRRYGSPSERAAGRARAALDFVPHEPRTRHVWVRGSDRPDALAYPGIVVAWRRERDHADHAGWVAQVAYVPAGAGAGEQLVVGWVPANRLIPSETPPPSTVRT